MATSIQKNFSLDVDLWNDIEAFMEWAGKAGYPLKTRPNLVCAAGLIWFLQASPEKQVSYLRQAGAKYSVTRLARARPPFRAVDATADDADGAAEDVFPPLPNGPPAAPKKQRKKRRKKASG